MENESKHTQNETLMGRDFSLRVNEFRIVGPILLSIKCNSNTD